MSALRWLARDGLRAAQRLDNIACVSNGLLNSLRVQQIWHRRITGSPLEHPKSSPWTPFVRRCAHVLYASPKHESIEVGLEFLCEVNRIETMLRQAAQFRTAAFEQCDMQCDSILMALELGTDDVASRVADTSAKIERLAARSVDLRDAEERMLDPPPCTTAQERFLLTANDVLFRGNLSVLPLSHADRAAMNIGSGLEAGRVTPVMAGVIYRNLLAHAMPDAETEVVSRDDGARAWLRVSRLGEHHLIDMSPGRTGTFYRIFPKTDERTPQPSHWVSALRSIARAQTAMCDCCASRHPTREWFGELCDGLLASIEEHERAAAL